MKNTYVFTVLLFLSTHIGYPQQKTIDSLEQQLVNPTNGKSKLYNLIDLGFHYQYINPEKGILHLNEAIQIAKKNKDSFRLANAYSQKAGSNIRLGNDSIGLALYNEAGRIYKTIDSTYNYAKLLYNKAIFYSERRFHKKALKTYQSVLKLSYIENDSILIGISLGQLGNEYMHTGDYYASMNAFLKGEVFLKHKKKEAPILYSSLKSNMGILYQRLNNFEIALKLYMEVIELAEIHNNRYLTAHQYNNIGTIYKEKNEFKKALALYKKALTIYKSSNSLGSIASIYNNMGTSYYGMIDYDKAIVYFDSATVINKKLKNYGLLASNYNNKAKVFLDKNDLLKATKHYDSCLFYATKIDDKRTIYLATLGISQTLSKQGYYKKAYTALEEARILKDNLLSDEKKEELAVLRAQYDFDKEKAILETEFEKDQAIQEAKISQQVLIRNASIGGGSFLILVLGVGFLLWRKKREADYHAQLSSSKLQSLRAQINPHFIFNSLNSINDYVLKNEKQTASDYLGEFSVMVRTILENTEEEEISLEEEIKFLKSYVALEQKRLKHTFNFNVFIDQNIHTEAILLPPSLLQPFIENSIWHGLSSKDDGMLSLSFTKSHDNLICIIEDNGIGLSTDSTKKETLRKSFGLQNVKNRLNLLKKAKSTNTNVAIENREEGGVSVKVTLPLSIQF